VSTYVIADVHGCYDEFQALLAKAGVNLGKDELIIAGDIVDRGPKSLEMLRFLESHPETVTFIRGNHDEGFAVYCRQVIETFEKRNPDGLTFEEYCEEGFYPYVDDYYCTIAQLTEIPGVNLEDFKKWPELIERMPYYVTRNVGGKRYIIVHAGFITEGDYRKFCAVGVGSGYIRTDKKKFYTWARLEGVRYGGYENVTVVFGHTPTIIRNYFYNQGRAFVTEEGKRRFINIDCGGVYRDTYPEGNFCLLRLDDEKFFYLYDDLNI